MTPIYLEQRDVEQKIADVIPLTRGPVREVDGPPADGEDVALDGGAGDEIPAHLLDPPGLVGHLTRWLTKTALYPQPLLALGAALTMVGTAAGRKYAGPTKSGTHLYVLAVAPTGAGKNHAPKLAKRIMRAADLGDLLGPGQFMSEPAVYQAVASAPLMLCFMDEFGSYLARINSPKQSSGYEKAISGVLRIMWGASFDTVQPPRWAKSSTRDVIEPIPSPSLSIYGMSVQEEFYAALGSADIANGFLNRFLILGTNSKPEEVVPSENEDTIPEALTKWLSHIAAVDPGTLRARAATPGDLQPEMRVDWACADARMIYKDFRESFKDRTGEEQKLMSRVPEMAVRLATILAIGRAKISAPMVSVEDITWGCEVALWSAERMVGDVANYMVENEYQGRAKEVLRYIKDAPRRSISHTDLSRKVKHRYKASDLRAILEGLEATDDIEITRHTVEGAKKPTDFIRYTGK